ncbi:MAG: chemotaxis protein CheB [Phycisphaerae bacterium]|jgi:two-component system CheB/CheR fusion protein
MKKMRGTSKKKKAMPVGIKAASFPIVGIGASAGGLEAYQELLKNLSAKPGMAVVFIMHLAPEHKSMLTELLARSTKMPVREIKNGMSIEINNVYVIPPSANVSIAGKKLKLSKMKNAGLRRMPVDWFFHSLAEEQGNRGIGVILSGTATDGTLGAEAIKTEGGIIFAQDEKSAKYDGMPQSAIAAGCVDFVLSPKRIAHELERIAKHPLISSGGLVKADKSITAAKGLEGIFDILRSASGLDFTHYKTNTINRRISRRMVLLKLENLKSYIKFLRENKGEVENLYEDLLIKVTSFFRDPKVFHILKKRVMPAILKNKTKGQEVRIWIPGCSSGEEAYSIAISLIEAMGSKKSAVTVRIFATDMSESNIDKARQGIYGKNIQNDFTPERLKRFFTKMGSSYKVSKLLREMCIFSKQNVFSDPPFSNLDLISCRNLLIYMQPVLQKKMFHNFHYGLRPGGFLLLGNSESASGYSNMFKTIDRRQRIFVKKYLPGESKLELGQKYYPQKKLEIKEKTGVIKGKETNIEDLVERIVLNEYAPCGVLIDSDMDVVQFRGHTGRFLESASGKPSLNIFKLAPKGLFQPLHTAIYKARGTKHTVKIEARNVKYNGRTMRVNITVIPVKSGPLKEELFLALFDDISGEAKSKNLPKSFGKSAAKDEKYVESLQRELSETKEYLQTVIEEQENVNEEVKTANEEILSSNEELLSTNEELETAKEELQSSNEELTTTNEELQSRNSEVVLLNNDLINLLTSINMPVIMMGTDLVIRRITPQAEKMLNVISSDIGRPISRIKLNVDIPDFEKILLEVIESHYPKTFETKDKEGNWYLAYIRPYRTLDNKISGVVAIFDDITERKLMEKKLSQSKEEEFKTVFDNAVDGIVIVDIESRKFYRGNDSFCRMLGYGPEEIKGLGVMGIHPEKDLPYVIEQFERQVKGESHSNEDVPVKRKDGSVFYADINSATIVIAGTLYLIEFFRDTTKRKEAEDQLRKSENKYRSLFVSSQDAIMTMEPPSWRYTSGNTATIKMFRVRNEAEFLTYDPWKLSPEHQPDGSASEEKAKEMIDTAMRKGKHFFEWTHKRTNGEEFSSNVLLSRIEHGEKVFLHATVRDITEQKHLEEELKNADEQKTTTEIRSKFTSMVSHELRSPLGAIKEGINLVYEGLAGEINEEQKDLLGTAKRNTDRLGRLISNVLDFQKISAGKMEFDIRENDINEAVLDVNKDMCLLAKEKGLDLVIEIDNSISKLKFDKDRIVQVLTNLVSNAIKYTEKGNITISSKQEDNAVHVIVRDTGIGIKAQDIKKLFQVFEQLDSTRDKKKGGTGLGLAISSDIILAHKGKIWAESEAGKGSAFHFTIPMSLRSRKKLEEMLVEEGKTVENDLKMAFDKQK